MSLPSAFPDMSRHAEAASATSGTAATLPEHIAKAGLQTGIDPDFIHSVIRAESGYNAKAVSPKGAQGLMQLMPATAAKLGVRDSLDPANNIDGGSRYLRELLLRYNGDAIKALAAYNAGPESVEKYQGVPPYRETRSYVARVINDFNRRKLCPNKRKDSVCQEPRLAASKPPVKDSKHPVSSVKDASKPRQTGQHKNAAAKEARTGHASDQHATSGPVGPKERNRLGPSCRSLPEINFDEEEARNHLGDRIGGSGGACLLSIPALAELRLAAVLEGQQRRKRLDGAGWSSLDLSGRRSARRALEAFS